MIGAMQAVAVRNERQKRRQQAAFATSRDTLFSNGISVHHIRRSSRPVRPNHLPLKARTCPSTVSSITTPSSYLSPVPLSSTGTTPVAGGATSVTPRQGQETLTAEQMVTDYCCYGKFPLLHFIVISLLIGITLLIVGLVQLKPNADSEAKKYLFLGSAALCFTAGFLFMAIRCFRRRQFRKDDTVSTPPRLRSLSTDESDYSICEVDPDPNSPVDSMALLQQRSPR